MAFINGKEVQLIAVKGDKGDPGVPESGQIGRVLKKINGVDSEWVQGKEILYAQSLNLYDASAQTPETISPHYYVDGVPYTTTQFDGSYNCTAPIEIAANTTYTIALIPSMFGTVTKPWNRASHGVFFYTKEGEYISGTTENTFITPANASYLRFNYAKGEGVTLERMNACCMMIAGETAPAEYVRYKKVTLEERFSETERIRKPIYYKVDGDTVYVVSKYNTNKDIVITLSCKGGNNIFDFWKIGLIENGQANLSENIEEQTYIIPASGDWHSPFKVKAANNVDGDNTSSGYFTGGNHQYNNTENGSTATGRTDELKIYADNRECANGNEGYAATLKIEWVNYVQASNTTKADGSGREVLKEKHRLTFNGVEWESFVELIPLELITINTWYGLQCSGLNEIYNRVSYQGGVNRGIYNATEYSESGDDKCYRFVAEGDEHRVIMEIDPLFDLGKRQYAAGITKGIFSQTYGKAYFSIIDGTYNFNAGGHYYLRGKYIFESV